MIFSNTVSVILIGIVPDLDFRSGQAISNKNVNMILIYPINVVGEFDLLLEAILIFSPFKFGSG
jgi:hypothetical protein